MANFQIDEVGKLGVKPGSALVLVENQPPSWYIFRVVREYQGFPLVRVLGTLGGLSRMLQGKISWLVKFVERSMTRRTSSGRISRWSLKMEATYSFPARSSRRAVY